MLHYIFKIKNWLKYPRTVNKGVLRATVTFKVHNLIEEDRVIGSNNEIEFTEEIISDLKETDNYFDIGSCIGFTAISAAKNSGCKVFAFEPDSELVEHLRYNVEINKVSNEVQVNQWAVSDSDGTVDFFTSGADGASPALAKTQDQSRKITVKTRKIDSAISEGILAAPAIVKIDIEGAELMALKGMEKTLDSPNGPRTIFIETHPPFMSHFGHTVEMLVQFLRDKNYKEDYRKKRGDEFHHKFSKL